MQPLLVFTSKDNPAKAQYVQEAFCHFRAYHTGAKRQESQQRDQERKLASVQGSANNGHGATEGFLEQQRVQKRHQHTIMLSSRYKDVTNAHPYL